MYPNIIKIGTKLPEFKLKGVDGKTYSPGNFSDKILVIVFTCNHCPYAQAYEQRIMEIQNDYSSKQVQVIGINSNDSVKYPDDSYENMVQRSKERNFNFPYLHDPTQDIARIFGAQCTPHVFVFQKGILKYQGRIDDNWEQPEEVEEQELRNALEALTQGKEPDIKETSPIGCSVKWKS